MSVDKFGNNGVEDEEDIVEISPFHSHQIHLDDLENVEGFNNVGGRDILYGFKLNERGLYERKEVKLFTSDAVTSLFDLDNVKRKTLLNIIYHKNKWILMKTKHDWEIDIKIENRKVSCKGDSLEILRIYNSGFMFGNLVPSEGYEDTAILSKFHGDYCIGSSEAKGMTVLEFIPKIARENSILTNPPVGSTFMIKGWLVAPHERRIITEGLYMKIGELDHPRVFWIIVRNTSNGFRVRSFPDNNIVVDVEDNVNFNKIKIYHEKYKITRIAFTIDDITNDEISYL